MHIFQNRFLRWNRESEPVNLNTMNPIIRTIFFFTYKGARCQFKLKRGQGRWHPIIKKFIFLKSTQKIHPGFTRDKVRKELFCFLHNPTAARWWPRHWPSTFAWSSLNTWDHKWAWPNMRHPCICKLNFIFTLVQKTMIWKYKLL